MEDAVLKNPLLAQVLPCSAQFIAAHNFPWGDISKREWTIDELRLLKDKVDWHKISPRFHFSDMKANPDLPWVFQLVQPDDLPGMLEYEKEHGIRRAYRCDIPEDLLEHFNPVMMSRHVALATIFAHPEVAWDYGVVACRKDFDEKYLDPALDFPWQFLAPKDIEKFADKPLNWAMISASVPMEFAMTHDYPWHYDLLSMRLTKEIYSKHFDKPWNFWYCHNVELAIEKPDEAWNWSALKPTLEQVLAHPELKWDVDTIPV